MKFNNEELKDAIGAFYATGVMSEELGEMLLAISSIVINNHEFLRWDKDMKNDIKNTMVLNMVEVIKRKDKGGNRKVRINTEMSVFGYLAKVSYLSGRKFVLENYHREKYYRVKGVEQLQDIYLRNFETLDDAYINKMLKDVYISNKDSYNTFRRHLNKRRKDENKESSHFYDLNFN